jgi:hypothetical protein
VSCSRCGSQLPEGSTTCAQCGTSVAVLSPDTAPGVAQISDERRPAEKQQPSRSKAWPERAFARPAEYPSFTAWMITGMFRNWRGAAAALFASWFMLPLALLGGAVGLVVGAVAGFTGGIFSGYDFGQEAESIPGVGSMLSAAMTTLGGPVGAIVGALSGAVVGFFGVLLLPLIIASSADPGVGQLLVFVQPLLLVLIGVVYTVYRIAAEGAWLAVSGARRPSRRERELLEPIISGRLWTAAAFSAHFIATASAASAVRSAVNGTQAASNSYLTELWIGGSSTRLSLLRE